MVRHLPVSCRSESSNISNGRIVYSDLKVFFVRDSKETNSAALRLTLIVSSSFYARFYQMFFCDETQIMPVSWAKHVTKIHAQRGKKRKNC